MLWDDLLYIDATGYHFPSFPEILTRLTNNYLSIYPDATLTPDTEDGQWLGVQAKGYYDTFSQGAATYNNQSPATGQGVGLSSNVKINGLKREIPTNSTAELVIIGQANTLISNGQAQDVLNQIWNLPTSVLIPDSGTITVTATAVQPGALAAAANTINIIYTPTRGWQTVNNPAIATPGAPVEDDAQLRERQSISTSLPALSVLDATLANVRAQTGVTVAEIYENDTDTTDGDGLPEHSISVVAMGGTDDDIAKAIANKKTPGTATYGTTNVVVIDAKGIPNTINFYRPTLVRVLVAIEIHNLPGYSSGYAADIAAAVAAYINNLQIGQDVLFTKLYTPANLPNLPAEGATFDINSIEISVYPASPAAANITIAFNELATCDVADIDITVV